MLYRKLSRSFFYSLHTSSEGGPLLSSDGLSVSLSVTAGIGTETPGALCTGHRPPAAFPTPAPIEDPHSTGFPCSTNMCSLPGGLEIAG